MTDPLACDLYCDGGVILTNPSPYGGTFGWVLVNSEGMRVEYGSGVILPGIIGKQKVTNNQAELFAALTAVESVLTSWPGYHGFLWTDSRITMYRMTDSFSFKGIPGKMRDKCLSLRRNRLWLPHHVGGHPTFKDLHLGYDKRGLPVSIHNVMCDNLCRLEAQRFLTKNGILRKKTV